MITDQRRFTAHQNSFKHRIYDSKASLSPSASMIYQNNFYKSNYNEKARRDNSGLNESNCYSQSNSRLNISSSSSKKRKIKSRDAKGIRMRITKLNMSSQPRVPRKVHNNVSLNFSLFYDKFRTSNIKKHEN